MRTIKEIILHCSATKEGKDFTVADITRWHKQKGYDTIGYHFVIYRDGSIHAGRAEQVIGAHCKNRNRNTIGICYIGGLDEDGFPKDTRTKQQKSSLVKLVKLLMRKYGLSRENIRGHYEFSSKACPSFSVEEFRKLV